MCSNVIFLCFVDRASRYNCKENPTWCTIILSIFRQHLHVSGVSMTHHLEVQPYVYNNWYLLFFLDDCLLSWLEPNQDNTQSTKRNKYQLLYAYGCTSLWWVIDTPETCRSWRKILRIICIKLGFLYRSNVIVCNVSINLCGTCGFYSILRLQDCLQMKAAGSPKCPYLSSTTWQDIPEQFLLRTDIFIYKYITTYPS
jgi:hypothetical protein